MTITTGVRAASTFPAYVPIGAGNLAVAYGSYAFTAEQAAADTWIACKVPAGAVILGGWLRAGDMDTGSETLDIDVGVSGNADQFGNFGILNGAAVTNYLPEAGILIPLHGELVTGPVTVTAETDIIVTFVDDAATFQAGTVSVVVFYVVP